MASKKGLVLNDPDMDSGQLSEMELAMFGSSTRAKKAVQSGLLVQADDGWRFGRVTIGRVGIAVPDDLNEQEYGDLGAFLLDIGSRVNWLLGDWLAYGENRQWGETYQRVAEQFGYAYQTLQNFAYVARSVDFSRRREKLSFTHHVEVAGLNPHDQDNWLNQAESNGWSVAQLRKVIRETNLLIKGMDGRQSPKAWEAPLKKLSLEATNLTSEDDRLELAAKLETLISILRYGGK